jgi:peptidoglycan/xylan/chitin deacetylase (PgdA/CDA1 family)
MQDAVYCFTVDDVAMEGYSTEPHLENVLQFCAKEDIKATFFVVPRFNGRALQAGGAYSSVLAQALAAGHAIAQHGLDHDRFQFGIPPKMVLDLPHEGPARAYLAEHRKEIERSLKLDNLRALLRQGRAILEDALGRSVDGFRAPCLSVCDNLFAALEAEGYRYDSSRCLQPGAWDLINGKEHPVVHPITRERFDAFQTGGRMRLFPLTAEYTWYLTRDKFDAFLNLAKHDFDACMNADIPFVPICHVSPIQEGEGDCGFALHRELIAYARESAKRQGRRFISATLAEVA